jgi:SAM-dependent methyltransferase
MDTKRKTIERNHGRRIAGFAEETWGWSTPAGAWRVKRRIREAMRFLGGSRGNLLEFGCGTGIFTQALLQRGYKVTSFDISFDLAQKAREKTACPRILIADAECLPFADNSFEAVFGVSVLHHLNLARSLREISRVLKKGGILVFSEPNMLNPQIFFQKNVSWLKKRLGDTPFETAFVRWGMKRKLIDSGFGEVTIYPFEFLHPHLPPFLINGLKKIEPFLEACPFIKEIAGSLFIAAKKQE